MDLSLTTLHYFSYTLIFASILAAVIFAIVIVHKSLLIDEVKIFYKEDSSIAPALIKKCNMLRNEQGNIDLQVKYDFPFLWGHNSSLQSIYCAYYRPSLHIEYTREELVDPESPEHLFMDWVESEAKTPEATVIVFPGVTGTIDSLVCSCNS